MKRINKVSSMVGAAWSIFMLGFLVSPSVFALENKRADKPAVVLNEDGSVDISAEDQGLIPDLVSRLKEAGILSVSPDMKELYRGGFSNPDPQFLNDAEKGMVQPALKNALSQVRELDLSSDVQNSYLEGVPPQNLTMAVAGARENIGLNNLRVEPFQSVSAGLPDARAVSINESNLTQN